MDRNPDERDIKDIKASLVNIDEGEVLHVGNKLVDDEGHVYLIPTPTTDPSDPLNWHPARKWAVLVILQLSLSIATNYMAVQLSFTAPFFMFAGIAAASLVGMFLVMPESRYDRRGNDRLPKVRLADYAAFRKTVGSTGEYEPWTLARQIKPWASRISGHKEHSVWWFFKRMAVYTLSPAMWWNAGINTIMCGSLLAASTYYASILVTPPWSWAPQNVALINVGPCLMAFVNWICLGWGNDKIVVWLAKRENGISRPEHRLVVLTLPIITGIISSIGFGALAQNYIVTNPGGDQPHWFSMVFIMSLYYQSFCGILEASLIYLANVTAAEDSLAVMTVVAVIRDTVSFGMGYGIVDFSTRLGFLTSFSIYGMLTGVIGLFGIPIYIYGEKIRQKIGLAV